jgi:hypothetical protein
VRQRLKVEPRYLTTNVTGTAGLTVEDGVNSLSAPIHMTILQGLAQLKTSSGGVSIKIVIPNAWTVPGKTMTSDFLEGNKFTAQTIGTAFLHWPEILKRDFITL